MANGMRRTPRESLRNLLEVLGQLREVRPLLRIERPRAAEDVLDVQGGLEVGQVGLHATPYLPYDRFGRHVLPRELVGQEFVPDGAERVDVARLGEGEVVRLDPEGAHDLGSQVAEPAVRNAHHLAEKKGRSRCVRKSKGQMTE